MKYNYKLPSFAKVLICVACPVTLATAIYYVLKCFQAFNLPQGSIAVNVSGAIVCLVLFTLSVSLATIKYKISCEFLCQRSLFFDLLAKRVKSKSVRNLVYKKDASKLYFSYYLPNADDPIIVLVSIDNSKVASFVNTIKQANPSVIYFEED